jgi:trypsin
MKLRNHIIAAAISLSACVSFATKFETKIVGGVEATRGEFPFIVSLQQNFGGHFCGGSLISKNWVLTAAHCVDSVDKVVIGLHQHNNTSGAEVIKPKQIIRHPQYSDQTSDYDYALIELSQDSKFQPVPINTTEIAIPTNGSQIMATVAGWGVTREDSYNLPAVLRKVDVPLVDSATCNADYKNTITDRMICAGYTQGGKDSCQGDSGGPLVATDKNNQRFLIGVVSWGEGCARANNPGVYSKVNAVTDWITQYVH